MSGPHRINSIKSSSSSTSVKSSGSTSTSGGGDGKVCISSANADANPSSSNAGVVGVTLKSKDDEGDGEAPPESDGDGLERISGSTRTVERSNVHAPSSSSAEIEQPPVKKMRMSKDLLKVLCVVIIILIICTVHWFSSHALFYSECDACSLITPVPFNTRGTG